MKTLEVALLSRIARNKYWYLDKDNPITLFVTRNIDLRKTSNRRKVANRKNWVALLIDVII